MTLNWRNYLTAREREVIAASDAAKATWLELNKERAAITNRAIQRAKYHATAVTDQTEPGRSTPMKPTE